ncbi:MAG: hypothetical protein U9R28_09290 [Pseudomonadota bacterium]|nr:hypothetical protein [Pseudomonadota bacterium]
MSKVLRALVIQLLALMILAIGVYLLQYVVVPPYPMWGLVLLQAVLAASFTVKFGLPSWWRWIQFVIPIGLFAAIEFEVNPWLGMAGFVVLWLIFANASKERVPLYLTNRTTRQAFTELIKQVQASQKGAESNVTFMDLGCGLGGNVVFMSQQPGVSQSQGVETAPIPYLIARIFTALRGGQVFAQDLWKTPIKDCSIVYAFLSTEPMPRLWEKAKSEMQPGSIFVSNSFPVPGVDPNEIWELPDSRQTKLFIYNL